MTLRAGLVTMLLAVAAASAACDDLPRQPLATLPSPVPAPPPPRPVEGYALSVTPEVVGPGGDLLVKWMAPSGGKWDWIGIFAVGALNCNHGWYEYTDGQLSGTVTFKAPTQPGQYEFRYHLDDGCTETARSAAVTVSPGG